MLQPAHRCQKPPSFAPQCVQRVFAGTGRCRSALHGAHRQSAAARLSCDPHGKPACWAPVREARACRGRAGREGLGRAGRAQRLGQAAAVCAGRVVGRRNGARARAAAAPGRCARACCHQGGGLCYLPWHGGRRAASPPLTRLAPGALRAASAPVHALRPAQVRGAAACAQAWRP